MKTEDRAKHVTSGEGKALWVAGDLVTLKVVGEDTDGAFVLGEEVSPPGGGPPPHVHRREDEIFCVLEGEYEFLVGGRTIRAGAGSVVYGPRDVPHSFKNVGTTPARMLAFVTPAGFQGFLEVVGEEATDESPRHPLVERRPRGCSRSHRDTASSCCRPPRNRPRWKGPGRVHTPHRRRGRRHAGEHRV